MLKVENITKSFGNKTVLKNIDFSLKKGQIAALIGENGAGKSTLMRVISGYIISDGGIITISNIAAKDDRLAVLNKLGYVQETSALYNDMSVYEYLQFVADLRQIEPETAQERIKEVVDMLQLQTVVLQKNDTLSKGFKKRTELAAVLLFKPEVLLLDEPLEGLDPKQKNSLHRIIKQYAKDHAVLMSTHTLEDVKAIADRVILLHKGNLLFNGTLAEFKKNAKDDLYKSFTTITKNRG